MVATPTCRRNLRVNTTKTELPDLLFKPALPSSSLMLSQNLEDVLGASISPLPPYLPQCPSGLSVTRPHYQCSPPCLGHTEDRGHGLQLAFLLLLPWTPTIRSPVFGQRELLKMLTRLSHFPPPPLSRLPLFKTLRRLPTEFEMKAKLGSLVSKSLRYLTVASTPISYPSFFSPSCLCSSSAACIECSSNDSLCLSIHNPI